MSYPVCFIRSLILGTAYVYWLKGVGMFPDLEAGLESPVDETSKHGVGTDSILR